MASISDSKEGAYGVVGAPQGENISKFLGYAVIAPAVVYTGVDTSKFAAYAVIQPIGGSSYYPMLLRRIQMYRSKIQ